MTKRQVLGAFLAGWPFASVLGPGVWDLVRTTTYEELLELGVVVIALTLISFSVVKGLSLLDESHNSTV